MVFLFEDPESDPVSTRFKARNAEASNLMNCERSCVRIVYFPEAWSSPRRPRYNNRAERAPEAVGNDV